MIDAAFIEAGAEPPRELPARGLYVIDAGDLGPSAFKADGVLDAAHSIYLFEDGYPLDARIVAALARKGILVLICATAFRAWFHHVVRLGLSDKMLATSASGDPRRLDA
jgi:hypothetical protein